MRWLACWVLLVFCACWAPAHAEVLVPQDLQSLSLRPHVEILEDSTRKLGIEEVEALARAGAFQRASGAGDLNLGFTSSAWWLRLELRTEPPRNLLTLLEVAYPQLDRVDFHAVDRGGRVHLVAGDLLPFGARPWPHRHIVFPLRLEPGQTTVVYLRAVSRGSLTVPLRLWEAQALHAHDQAVYAAHALYFGMLLALGVYNLLLYVSVRDRVYLAYVANTAALALGMLSTLGLGHQFLWPHSPLVADRVPLLGFALYGFFALAFMREFLQVRHWAPWLDRVLQALALASLAIAIVGTLLPGGAFFVIAMAVLGSSAALLAIVVGALALVRQRPGARMFVLATAIFQVGLVAYGLRTLDLLPTNVLTSYGLQWGSVIEMMLLSLALAGRIQALRFAKEQAQAAALHDRLTGLANRAHLDQHLGQALARSRRTGRGLALLLIDLDGFKTVNDTRGHAVGDRLLRCVAQRLLDQVRESDLVARYGGDEFVVVCEGVEAEAVALALAQKLLAALEPTCQIGDEQFTVSASIGVAWAAGHGARAGRAGASTVTEGAPAIEPEALLARADEAMYQAKRMGKGRYAMAHPATATV